MAGNMNCAFQNAPVVSIFSACIPKFASVTPDFGIIISSRSAQKYKCAGRITADAAHYIDSFEPY